MSEQSDLIGNVKRIPGMALQIMLLGILIPTAFYAFKLRDPTPAQLLVAICMSLFSAVVFLWILDAVSILRFRSAWVSRSVYGAAIASVLGTSVAVYQDSFAASKYPFQGAWEITILDAATSAVVADRRLALAYSDSSASYWGYSNVETAPTRAAGQAIWLEVRHFRPTTKQISLRLMFADGSSKLIEQTLATEVPSRVFATISGPFRVSLSRPSV